MQLPRTHVPRPLHRSAAWSLALCGMCLPIAVADGDAQKVDVTEAFEERELKFTGGTYENETFRYRLLPPPNVKEGETYPLVVFLHGAGERGTDNKKQLTYFPEQMAQPKWRNDYPCYILAPQCRLDARWVEVDWGLPETHDAPKEPGDQMKVAMKILHKTLQEEQVDLKRVYLTGLSMGGYGSWDLAIRQPKRFAALAVVCGGADNSTVAALKDVPVWVGHGSADGVVPVARGRLAVQALKKAGGNPVYVEYPKVYHNAWVHAYPSADGLVPWMFQQKKP